MSQNAIEIRNVTKIFSADINKKPVTAVDRLDLSVEEGEVFAFLGANGAGKTTTIKMISRLLFATKGTISIYGESNRTPRAMRRVGFLPEQPRMYDYLSGREFLHFIASLFSLPLSKHERVKRVERCLERVGMADRADRAIRTYSRGMMQRIGLAQALINDPDLLILDEPMANLDPFGRKEFRDMILELKREGKTLFFSSHIISDAEMIADRVGILSHGTLINVGKLSDLLESRDASVEVTFSIQSPEKTGFDMNDLVRQENLFMIRLPEQSRVKQTLDTIYQSGGQVVSVIPQKKNLEDVFMSKMGKA